VPPTQLPEQQSAAVPQPVAFVGRHAAQLPAEQNLAPAQQSKMLPQCEPTDEHTTGTAQTPFVHA
jgi:hypothetical protein